MAQSKQIGGIYMSIIEILWGNENSTLMQILTILVILDYITGVCIAIRLKKLSSTVGFQGISTKVVIFIILSICNGQIHTQ